MREYKNCPYCGEKMESWETRCLYCDKDTTAVPDHITHKKCPWCGESVKKIKGFCQFCGKEIPTLGTYNKKINFKQEYINLKEAEEKIEILGHSFGKSHDQILPDDLKENAIKIVSEIGWFIDAGIDALFLNYNYVNAFMFEHKSYKEAKYGVMAETLAKTCYQWGFICIAIGGETSLGELDINSRLKHLSIVNHLFKSIIRGYFDPYKFDFEHSGIKITYLKLSYGLRSLYNDLPDKSSILADVGAKHSPTLTIKNRVDGRSPMSLYLAKLEKDLM